MPSTPVTFDSYVLKCWAEAARHQTLTVEALADFLDPHLEPHLEARRDTRLGAGPDTHRD